MPHQRKRNNSLIMFIMFVRYIAVLTFIICLQSRLVTARSSNDGGEKAKARVTIADLFKSFYKGPSNKADAPKDNDNELPALSAGQLSAFLKQFQKPQNQGPQQSNDDRKDRRRGKSNRRKVLYDLSIRAHYERLLLEHESKNATKSSSTTKRKSSSASTGGSSSCEYYNDGMKGQFDLREMARSNNPFSKVSHWTFRLCPKQSMSQIHVEPSALTDGEDDASNPQILKLPDDSILSNNIQFSIQVNHGLGTYLPPTSPDFTSIISSVWGAKELRLIPLLNDRIEYYIGGDACNNNGKGKKRHSKVIYDEECCHRRESMMEKFFSNVGQVMIRSTSEPKTCLYELWACHICPQSIEEEEGEEEEEGGEEQNDASPDSVVETTLDPHEFSHMLQTFLQYTPSELTDSSDVSGTFPPMPPSQIEANKQLLREMYIHAYDSYFYNAFPASELKPLSCTPGLFDLVRVPALTLIDTLDTFIIMGNYTEFARSVERLRYLDERMRQEYEETSTKSYRKEEKGGLFSVDQNVSVFETTIRILGGLLSAHQLAVAFMTDMVPKSDVWDEVGEVLTGPTISQSIQDGKVDESASGDAPSNDEDDEGSCRWESLPDNGEAGQDCEPEDVADNSKSSCSRKTTAWEYDGILLDLAHDIGKRLQYAFDTETGIPYGTVNLLSGIPPGETPVASLAGAGTLTLEFELLSRLTGDQSFGKSAKLATRALWMRGSANLHLYGKHINTQSGQWAEQLSGIGSNSDSFYEYLAKHYLLFPDDSDFWTMFVNAYAGVHGHSRLGEFYVDVDMNYGLNGNVRQVFESLMAFYPGLQVLLGELVPSAKTLNSFFLVREFLGLLPERFNFVHWRTEGSGDVHPLRPELLESCYFLHLASIGLHGSRSGPCSNSRSSPHTSSWLWAADFALHAVHKLSWTPCGFATVTQVGPTTTGGLPDLVSGDVYDPIIEQSRLNIQHHNEMPSYFLSETIKYLYLTFDAENSILHRDTERDWIFTTEAHPIHYQPVSNSTHSGDDHINAQLDQVRSLLKDRLSNSPSSSNDVKSDSNASEAEYFSSESWTLKTKQDIYVQTIQGANTKILMSKQREDDNHDDFESGPPLQSALLSLDGNTWDGLFSFEASDMNHAHVQFDSDSKMMGIGLAKSCPNYHHPDLMWTHALHGDGLDYNAAHVSSLSNEALHHRKDSADPRMRTALASVAFYGTDYYNDGVQFDTSKSCPIEEAPKQTTKSETKVTKHKPQPSIPGATRYDMGKLGTFDISAFPQGDGFIVRHVDTNELLEVSIFNDDPKSTTIGSGAVILVVLTVPPKSPEDQSTISDGASPHLSSRRTHLAHHEEESHRDDNTAQEPEASEYQRHVVVADLGTNAYKCRVVLTKKNNEEEGDVLFSIPCSPAFFGRASMPSLKQNGGQAIRGRIMLPPPGNELGCKNIHVNEQDEEEGNVIQIVRRGTCHFMEKALNHRDKGGVIVLNSAPYELFVMAGDKPQSANEDLPVSVLVSWKDGESMLQLLEEEQSEGSDIEGYILLTKSDESTEFPYVRGTEEALQILASNGWGIHAVPQQAGQQGGWQLFITQHDKTAVH